MLALGAFQGAIVSVLLIARRANQPANRILAALIAAYTLRLVPFILGYAGFYDVYPWLSFAPFALDLAYGPLIYLYVVAATVGALPRRWWVHLGPAAIQLAYYTAIFVQPLSFKNAFDGNVHVRYVVPVETLAMFISLGVYLALSVARYRTYTRWLHDETSVAGENGLLWIRNFLALFCLSLVLNIGFEVYSAAVRHLNYFGLFPLYVWYTVLVYYVALEGWRNSGHPFVRASMTEPPAVQEKAPVDWEADAGLWRDRTFAEGQWRDPELTLPELAKRTGSSAAHISKLVNRGLGQNFNEAINRMRVAEARRRLQDPSDTCEVLEIALDAGFSSKASFNRCFKAYTGTTPSAVRAGHQ